MGTEAFWNGLFDSRWDDCTFGAEAIRLVYRLRRLGYCAGTRRMYGQMVVHFGHVLAGSERVAAEQINEAVIQKFLREHVPMCRCYRQPPGRRYIAMLVGLLGIFLQCYAKKVCSRLKP